MTKVQAVIKIPSSSSALRGARAMRADRIATLEDAKLWMVEHDAHVNEWWHQQWHENTRLGDVMKGIDARLRTVERKVIWTSGAGAAAGAILGSAITIALAFWKMGG